MLVGRLAKVRGLDERPELDGQQHREHDAHEEGVARRDLLQAPGARQDAAVERRRQHERDESDQDEQEAVHPHLAALDELLGVVHLVARAVRRLFDLVGFLQEPRRVLVHFIFKLAVHARQPRRRGRGPVRVHEQVVRQAVDVLEQVRQILRAVLDRRRRAVQPALGHDRQRAKGQHCAQKPGEQNGPLRLARVHLARAAHAGVRGPGLDVALALPATPPRVVIELVEAQQGKTEHEDHEGHGLGEEPVLVRGIEAAVLRAVARRARELLHEVQGRARRRDGRVSDGRERDGRDSHGDGDDERCVRNYGQPRLSRAKIFLCFWRGQRFGVSRRCW
mmetsp:Transcript_14394/g.42986  ORF Transcript_14394/g.42986 Transcript_14394/m.42986 type:complete len:335 (+) Transcript_14394:698-1702(+)